MTAGVRYYRDAYGGAYFARARGGWRWHHRGGLVPSADDHLFPKGHFHEYVSGDGMYFDRLYGQWVFYDPDHGTMWKHREHGCECGTCMRAARREWRRLKANERPNGYVLQGTDMVRRHIYFLLSCGMTQRTIGRVAGISPGTVPRIWSMKQTRCTQRVAQAILGVTRDDIITNDKVEGWRIHKMVGAMTAAGITQRQLGSALRYTYPRGVYRITNGKEPWYTRRTFDRLALLCRALAAQGRVPATVLVEVGAI